MADEMTNRDGREALRGAEEETFDLLAEVLTSEKWAELLRAPLERAARQGNRGLAQKLVEAGAEIGNALHEATRGGHGGVVSYLLGNGASIDVHDCRCYGYAPLHVAAEEGQTEMVQLLLLKGAETNTPAYSLRTPLYLAASNGHAAIARALLAAGRDVRLRRSSEYAEYADWVMRVAAKGGHVETLEVLIKHGLNEDFQTNKPKTTPLHESALYDRVEAINLLLEAGANAEARDESGCTPLHYAARQPCLGAALALLKHGANVNAQSNYQDTPLHRAAANAGMQGTEEMVDSMLRSGADETILNRYYEAASDVVAQSVEQEYQLIEDVHRVRELLSNAPADRAWRRRGYLVMCRAHPDRMRQTEGIGSAFAGVKRSTRSSAKLTRTETSSCSGTAGGSTADGRTVGDWAVVMAKVLGLQDKDVFRTIVEYL